MAQPTTHKHQMIKVKIILGTSAVDLEDSTNDWLKVNADSISIIRIGDAHSRSSNTTGYILTIVYSTNPEMTFVRQ